MIIGVNGKIGSGKDTVGKIIQYLQCHNTGKITIQDVISNPEHEWWLEEQSKFEIKKFAGKLKLIGSILLSVPVEMFEDQEFKKTNLGPEWNYIKRVFGEHFDGFIEDWEDVNIPMTYREFLQKLGTEAMRDGLHTNVWVNALFADYRPGYTISPLDVDNQAPDKWIITDMRFPNEMDAVVERKGITIRVVRSFNHKMGSKETGTLDLTPLHPSETALDDAEFDYEIINDGSIDDLVEKVKEILIKENII
jgi:hypothetical protein